MGPEVACARARRLTDFLQLLLDGEELGDSFRVAQSGWFESLAQQTANNPQRRRSCILLWMNGGPSQMDTFDLKPGHANGGPFRAADTAVAGIRISEHLPKIGQHMRDLAIIRSMTSREGDHNRGNFFGHTGYLPQGSIQYPTIGALLAKELGRADNPLPNFVSISPYGAKGEQSPHSAGFLGPNHAPLLIAEQGGRGVGNNYEQELRVPNLVPAAGVTRAQADARIDMLQGMDRDFAARSPDAPAQSHRSAIDRAVRLMRSTAGAAFNLDDEPAQKRDAYGRNLFGQGCLLARRLIERNVPFVEVGFGNFAGSPFGWDTHTQNFTAVQGLSGILNAAWGTLMDDLRDRSLLQSTLIVWMGEFGRTPRINNNQGRDHYPNAWTTVLAGGGIRGGRVFGRTSADGTTIEGERPVTVPDFLATVCRALGVDPSTQNMSNEGRPIRIAEASAAPVNEIIA